MDFAKIISSAQLKPDGAPPEGLDLFSPPSSPEEQPPLVTDVPSPGRVPGVPGYALDYQCQRFFIGKEMVAIDQNTKVFEDRDESAELKSVMDRCIKGGGVIFNRKESILQDGSIVVWMEWGEPTSKKVPKEDRDYLTTAELKSPKRVTPRSLEDDAAEEAASGTDTPALGDEETSPNNEDDW